MYLNNKIFIGPNGGYFYIKNKKKIYVSEKHLLFRRIVSGKKEPLFPSLPVAVGQIIIDMKRQMEAMEDNYYRFLLSMTQSQRELFCFTVRKELQSPPLMFRNSISLALKYFPEPSRIRRKALLQLQNF